MIRIALAQTNPLIGDVAGNLASVLEFTRKAASKGADIVAFPELTLLGYPPKDMLLDSRMLDAQNDAVQTLLRASQELAPVVVVGVALPNPAPGKPLFNGLLAIRGGKIERIYRKQLLPTYDVFDERRYFEPGGRDPAMIEVGGHRVGLLICEDGWNFVGNDYAADPVSDLAAVGAELVISINASPFVVGKAKRREATLLRAGLPVAYVNQVGGNDDLVFDGHSFFGSAGIVQGRAPGFAEALPIADFNGREFLIVEAAEAPVEVAEEAQMFEALALGLSDYLAKTGFGSVVVGSSGGIDSAVVLALCALALGPERVTAITMPSKFSSEGSVSDSAELCRRLGVRLVEHPIFSIVETFEAGFAGAFCSPLTGLAAENLQARIRGTILMEWSNMFHTLLISTGNKSEVSVGYCTLYGDTNGGIGLIGDLFKTDVYRLARWINERFGGPIPAAIIDKSPSAELAPGQRDQDSLPPYEILDDLLKELLEGAPVANVTPELRSKVETLLARAEFKRRQAPPIIKVRSRSFGAGRQVPIAARSLA
ncbi:MAG: NAD+ synthase [Sulfuritalea sp.]|nr:NAD+ synthase [Sulfuritalea sp.]MDP1985143.1 NAD+ synthase [Sulfuritalea sp.]